MKIVLNAEIKYVIGLWSKQNISIGQSSWQ